MIEWIASSCVLILVVAALRYLLRGRVSLRLQYALWALVLVRLLVPVQLGASSVSVINAVERIPGVREAETVSGVEGIEFSPSADTPGYGTVYGYEKPVFMPDAPDFSVENRTEAEFERMKTAIELRDVLQPLWILGVAVLLTALVASNVGFGSGLAGTRRRIEAAYTELPVYISNAVDTPCLFGVFRPAIYVTPEAASDAARLRHCIEHETTHYRHGDHIWAFLRGVCLALHWYNPLVWWSVFLSRRDAELACDEATIRRIGEAERADYGRTLIEMTCRKRTAILTATTTMTGSKSGIRERIILIAKKPKTALYTLVAVVLIAALAVGCTFTGAKDDENSGTDAAAPLPSVSPGADGDGAQGTVLAMLFIPNDNADGFETLATELGRSAQALIDELIEHNALPEGVEVLSFETDALGKGESSLALDLNGVFLDAVTSAGTAGEAMLLGSIVNTFLTTYEAYEIWLTCEGEYIETEHIIYELPFTAESYGADDIWMGGYGPGTVLDGIEVTLYLPNDNADGFVKKPVRIETGEQSIIDALIEHGALPEGVRVNAFSYEPSASSIIYGAPALKLDLNDVFLNAVTTTGTAGEAMYFGSVVNTFLSAYDAYEIWITCGGETIETGHNIYDFPLTASPAAQGDEIAWADLDGDGANESISVRQLDEWEYELIVSDGPDSVLWSARLALPHVGWDSYFLCELDMKEYILQYNPYMGTGPGGYYYTLISLETPGGTVVARNSVQFEVMDAYLEPRELFSFADEINGLLSNSTLLISTQGGEAVIGPADASAYCEDFSELPNFLSAEELAFFNEMLAPTRYDEVGALVSTEISCFFTSYYKDVRDLNFYEFLRYFPPTVGGDSGVDKELQLQALKEIGVVQDWVENTDMLPVPFAAISGARINEALHKYAGIGIGELSGVGAKDVPYLPQYDLYYNFTSDFGAGAFYPSYGVRDGDIVRLYEQSHAANTFGDVLTLRQTEDGSYLIVSHKPG